MTGFQSKRAMAQERLAILESPSPGVSDMIRVEQLEQQMNDMTFDREEAEQFLVDDDFEYIMQTDNGLELLRDYLALGFKGYMNFTDEELVAEINERKQMKELT